MKTKFFTITENVIDPSVKAKEAYADQTQTFRLKDDDDNVYFVGKMRPTQTESLFIPLDTFGEQYGCTSIEILEDGEWNQV